MFAIISCFIKVDLTSSLYSSFIQISKGKLKNKLGEYEGEFVDNRMHGKGTWNLADGSVYIGTARRHGAGRRSSSPVNGIAMRSKILMDS